MAVKIKGLIELQRKLDALPKVAKDHIKKEMEGAATEAVSFMKRLAPVLKEPHSKRVPGALRDSIQWTWGAPPAYSTFRSVLRSSVASDLTITISSGNTRVRYSHLVEFGTQNPNYPAQPFFYPGWRAVNKGRNNPKARVRRAVRDAARQVAAGG